MTIHDRYGLTRVINAAGTFTPLGVSRSPAAVARAAAEALSEFYVIDELQEAASAAIARLTGAEAGVVTHCASAGITLSVAAAMTGTAAEAVAALPDTSGMANRVVLPAGHAVNYGHPIVQAIRLAGAEPVLAGSEDSCTREEIARALEAGGAACLLLVSSRLVRGEPVGFEEAVGTAHDYGVPVIIDGAAQDMRIGALLATGADLVVVSAQKYMAAPTAGLAIGRRDLVAAVRAQEKGIGRGMKATKEAICGVLAAIEAREALDTEAWRREQDGKVAAFLEQANGLPGASARAVPDPAGMPLDRVHLRIEPGVARIDARGLADALRDGQPTIRVMEHGLADGEIILELVHLSQAETDLVLGRIASILARPAA